MSASTRIDAVNDLIVGLRIPFGWVVTTFTLCSLLFIGAEWSSLCCLADSARSFFMGIQRFTTPEILRSFLRTSLCNRYSTHEKRRKKR
jgi:hypothetical protein